MAAASRLLFSWRVPSGTLLCSASGKHHSRLAPGGVSSTLHAGRRLCRRLELQGKAHSTHTVSCVMLDSAGCILQHLLGTHLTPRILSHRCLLSAPLRGCPASSAADPRCRRARTRKESLRHPCKHASHCIGIQHAAPVRPTLFCCCHRRCRCCCLTPTYFSVSLESFLFLERTVRMPFVTATGTATAAAASQEDMQRSDLLLLTANDAQKGHSEW